VADAPGRDLLDAADGELWGPCPASRCRTKGAVGGDCIGSRMATVSRSACPPFFARCTRWTIAAQRRRARPDLSQVGVKRGLGSGSARNREDRPHGTIGEERAGEIVVTWQRVGQLHDQRRAPPRLDSASARRRPRWCTRAAVAAPAGDRTRMNVVHPV
jgi:hypothetical protein